MILLLPFLMIIVICLNIYLQNSKVIGVSIFGLSCLFISLLYKFLDNTIK